MMKRFSIQLDTVRAWFSVRRLVTFWYAAHRQILGVFFVGTVFFGAWEWYYSLYRYVWTDEEKLEFLASYMKETAFRSDRFEEVIRNINERQTKYEAGVSLQHDVFHLDRPPKSEH